MATQSVSGLVSGLDTATIISQLMQVEAQPQTLLKNRLTTEQSTVSSLQALNAKFAALVTRAHDLATPAGWTPASATSSSTYVTAAAGATAAAGTFSFTVQQTAAAHQLTFTTAPQGSDVVAGGAPPTVRVTKHDGSHTDVPVGNGTVTGVVNGLNSAGVGVTASAVRLDDGSYRLRVVSDTTGGASDFTLTQTDGTALLGGAAVVAGRDAEITVGPDTIHSASNTFTGLTQGLDVTLAANTPAGTAVDVTTTRDAAGAQASLKGLVDAANDLLAQIDTLTAYDATSKTSGALAGDATVRALRDKVLDTVTKAADGTTMAAVGVQTDRYGKITFDAAVFANAYATDTAMVAAKLGGAASSAVPGFAARLEAMAKQASDSVNGTLTTSIQTRQTSVKSLKDSIADWDVRLAARRESLNTQFSALEVALQKLQSQSTWLAGQISSLSSSKSS